MNTCNNPSCDKPAKVKYCSRSCAAQVNNRLIPKLTVQGSCNHCGVPAPSAVTYCKECWSKRKELGLGPHKKLTEADRAERKKRASGAVSSWRRRVKVKALEYLGGECVSCGYNKSPWALQFHHKDPALKDFRISGVTIGWERIRQELDKCILLCANCHAEEHERLWLRDLDSNQEEEINSFS